MLVDHLRAVTHIDIRVPQVLPNHSRVRGAAPCVFPLQTLSIQIRASLLVGISSISTHPAMRHLAMESGESDPLQAWEKLLSRIHATPVMATRTSDSKTATGPTRVPPSAHESHWSVGGAFVAEVYPPVVATEEGAGLRSSRQLEVDSHIDGSAHSYLSLAWPENPVEDCFGEQQRTSFSPPGGALARNPGASFFHSCPSRCLEGVLTGRYPTRSVTPSAETDDVPEESSQRPQYTYEFSLTVPNVANGSGCVAVRLNISPPDLITDPQITSGSRSPIEDAVDWETIDAPMAHMDVTPAIPAHHNNSAATAGGDRDDDGGTMEPSFLGTAVLPICVRAALECSTRSRIVAPNRTHILVALTNVSPLSTQVQAVEFDLLSTRIGQFKDSLDYVANKSPDYRTAPKAPEDDLVALLARSVIVIPLASDEMKPYLQPHETYCFQFVIQLKPHLAHILTSPGPSVTTPGSVRNVAGGASFVVVDTNEAVDASASVVQQLRHVVKKTFVSAVHVQFHADAWADRSSVSFRAEQSVPWALS